MSSAVLQKITAPIHRSTAYDFNVQLDHTALRHDPNAMRVYGSSTPDEEHLSVKEHEILIRRKHRDGVHGSGRLQVFSSLNSVVVDKALIGKLVNLNNGRWTNEAAAEELIEKRLAGRDRNPTKWTPEHSNDLSNCMHQLYEYVGVAITPQDYVSRHSRQESQGFACTRGGLNTLINNGSDKIKAGQKVYISFRGNNHLTDSPYENPSHHASGIPHQKALVTLENKDKSQEGLVDAVLRQMHRLCMDNDQSGGNGKWLPLAPSGRGDTLDVRGMPVAELCRHGSGSFESGPTNKMKLIVLKPNPRTNGGTRFVQVASLKELNNATTFDGDGSFIGDGATRCIYYLQDQVYFDRRGLRPMLANLKCIDTTNNEETLAGNILEFMYPGSTLSDGRGNIQLETTDLLSVDALRGPNPALGGSLAYMLQQVIAGESAGSSPFAHLLRHTVEVAIKAHEMQRRDPIGVAVSGARPGEPFDIVLHG